LGSLCGQWQHLILNPPDYGIRDLQLRLLDIQNSRYLKSRTSWATGITTYLQNGGKLEIAQQMAGHESARTTGLYDRRNDTVALDEVERVVY
jgi:hypothetical protein